MERFLDGWRSPVLGKEMEIAVYGHYGPAFLLFPSAGADYLEYERFQLIDSIAHFLDAGRIKVFLLSGKGEFEDPNASWEMGEVMGRKGITNWVELWGEEYRHDWPTWREMLPSVIERYF